MLDGDGEPSYNSRRAYRTWDIFTDTSRLSGTNAGVQYTDRRTINMTHFIAPAMFAPFPKKCKESDPPSDVDIVRLLRSISSRGTSTINGVQAIEFTKCMWELGGEEGDLRERGRMAKNVACRFWLSNTND